MAKSTRKGHAIRKRFTGRRSGNKSPKLSSALPPTNTAKIDEGAATPPRPPTNIGAKRHEYQVTMR